MTTVNLHRLLFKDRSTCEKTTCLGARTVIIGKPYAANSVALLHSCRSDLGAKPDQYGCPLSSGCAKSNRGCWPGETRGAAQVGWNRFGGRRKQLPVGPVRRAPPVQSLTVDIQN